MKILIVDDMEENLYLLETILTGSGYGVVTAKDGTEALDKLKKNPIDIIVSDILMPKMDGFQLCRECKKDQSLKKIPFIFYTATYTNQKDEDFALSLGAEKFLVKPQEPEVFLKILKEIIKASKKRTLVAPKEPIKEEEIYLTEYNKRLIHKLEKKILDLEKRTRDLKERAKELNCLWEISNLVERPGISLEAIIKGTVNLLPSAWQYSRISCARIILDSKEYKSKNFKETAWRQASDIILHKKPVGTVEVYYLEERPQMDEGPFLKEEGDLINIVGKRLGKIIERVQAEETLQRYKYIVSSSTDMLALLDKQFTYLAANNAYIEAFKLTFKQLIGNTTAKVFGEEFFNTVIKSNADRCLGGEEVNYQEWMDFPAYGWCYMDVNYYPYYSKDKKIIGFVVNSRNITERKHAIEKIKKLAKFPAENPNPVLRISKEGTVLYHNSASESLLRHWHYKEGKPLQDKWLQFVSDALEDNDIKTVEIKISDKVIFLTFTPIIKNDFVNVYGLDITKLKRAEEELLKSKALLSNTERMGKIGGWEFNVETLTQTWTDETFRILEIDLGKGEPKVPKGLDFITPAFRPLAEQGIQRAIEYGEPYDQEWEIITTKGNKRWVHAVAKAYQEEGKTKRVSGSFQDITELKQSQEKLQKTMDATLNTMSKIIEVKDPYTAGHQQRVSQLATAVARELNLSQDKIEGIRIASIIHDIGKIGIPSEILSKPTKLTDIEFSLIKGHSQIGYNILKNIDFSYPIASIVLQHHEKLNGSGYPNNLKGDEILLEAKIICVADVVEAMSSHRPYRPALGIDTALEEINKNKGILYETEVVDVCLKLFKEKSFKFQ